MRCTGSPRSLPMFTCCSLAEGGTRLSACGLIDGYSVVIRRRPHPGAVTPHPSSPPANTAAGGSPRPPQIRQVRGGSTSRQVITPVPRVYLFGTLAAPTPSDGADVTRLCQGCSRPPGRLPGQAALSLSLIHISEPTRLGMLSYAVFCL